MGGLHTLSGLSVYQKYNVFPPCYIGATDPDTDLAGNFVLPGKLWVEMTGDAPTWGAFVAIHIRNEDNDGWYTVISAGAGPTGAAGGDLAGTYPNPTIKSDVGLTGNPTVPTQTAGNSSTRAASTAFVMAALAAVIGTAPGVLDTLGEISDAINDDANLYTTLVTALAGKQALAGNLTALAALTLIADRLIYADGSGTVALTVFTAAARALLDDASADDMLATLSAVKLAGQLGGSVTSPDVRGLRESTGPTLLTMGGVTDGEYLKRSGSTLVGDTPTVGAPVFEGTLVYGSGTVSVGNATEVEVGFNLEAHDTENAHDNVTAPEEIVAWVDGYYVVEGALNYAFHATGARWAYPFKNGAGFPGGSGDSKQAVTQSADSTTAGFSVGVHLDAGDVMTCVAYQTSGGSLNINRGSSHFGLRLLVAD